MTGRLPKQGSPPQARKFGEPWACAGRFITRPHRWPAGMAQIHTTYFEQEASAVRCAALRHREQGSSFRVPREGCRATRPALVVVESRRKERKKGKKRVCCGEANVPNLMQPRKQGIWDGGRKRGHRWA